MPVTYPGPVVSGSLTTYFGHDDGHPISPETVRAPTPWTQHDAAKAAFLANVTGAESEDFESGYVDDQLNPITLTFVVLGTAIFSVSSGFINRVIPPATNGTGRYGTSGEFYYSMGSSGGDVLTFSRSDITALGYSGVDVGDFAGQLTVTVNFVDLTSEVWEPPHMIGAAGASPVGGSVAFFGIAASKPIASVVFDNTAAGADVFALDDFIIAVAMAPIGVPGAPADCGAPLIVSPCPQLCAVTVPAPTIVSPTGSGTWSVPAGVATCGAPLIVNSAAQLCEV